MNLYQYLFCQNSIVYVIDIKHQKIWSRSLGDLLSGLSDQEIEWLSVAGAVFYQDGYDLYIAGGFGLNSSTGATDTKPILTKIKIKGLIKWVTRPLNTRRTAKKH